MKMQIISVRTKENRTKQKESVEKMSLIVGVDQEREESQGYKKEESFEMAVRRCSTLIELKDVYIK